MKKHFVEFFSPGTMVSETTTLPIDSWDISTAKELARTVKERHGATPFGFRFLTRERKDTELDSSITNTSNFYYLGGTVLSLEEIKSKNNPQDRILILNMETNGYNNVIVNTNSWKVTRPLRETDQVLDWP